ncbi:MAG: patatin-like phospholipase family protein [Spirochaetales bacterium]|jgi:NTE family protein
MLNRMVILALMFIAGLSGARAQNVDAAFPPNDTFRVIAEPIRVGMEGFSARLDKIRAEGREPLGLVLAGGSARAYAHIGVLQELEKAGIRPDFIVANSMGAVVGMLYAAGISPDMIAKIVGSVPPESYFSLILPTKGGLINADPFAAAVEEMVGHLDLSETPIPIIVTAEDLKSRRQVELSAGDFAKVMATTFAMPSIFEPVPFGGFLLVDGGTTNLVPVGIAAKYSSLLIVSTAFSDKGLAFNNLLSVLSRAFDIGKSRAGMKELMAASPFVIRNKVEDISYMQFASPESIIERGRTSARAVIGTIAGNLPATALGTIPPQGLTEARLAYDTSIPKVLRTLKRGALPYVAPSIRFKLRYKLMNEFEFAPMALDGQNYLGIAAVAAAGRTRTVLSTLVGLAGTKGRQWALTAGFAANPFDTFRASAELRLWGDFSDWPSFFLAPASIEGLAALTWLSGGDDLIVQPYVNGSTEYVLAMGNLDWEARAGLAFDAKLGNRSLLPGKWAWAGFLSARAGAFADRFAGTLNYGPEFTLKAGTAAMGIASFRGRATGRFDASGSGLALRSDDAYRGNALAGKAPLVMAANAELVWLAKKLEFDAGEILLVKDIELGPYFDCAWLAADGSGPMPDAFAGGLTLSATTSFAGLAPFDMSLYLGLDSAGYPVLGLRSGRLFPVAK